MSKKLTVTIFRRDTREELAELEVETFDPQPDPYQMDQAINLGVGLWLKTNEISLDDIDVEVY